MRGHVGRPVKSLGLELDVIPYNIVMMYGEKAFKGVKIEDGSMLMKQARSIKSAWEIELLRNSCSVLDSTFRAGSGNA